MNETKLQLINHPIQVTHSSQRIHLDGEKKLVRHQK